jgi:hypothetical protein
MHETAAASQHVTARIKFKKKRKRKEKTKKVNERGIERKSGGDDQTAELF